jgi:hypothetical protein
MADVRQHPSRGSNRRAILFVVVRPLPPAAGMQARRHAGGRGARACTSRGAPRLRSLRGRWIGRCGWISIGSTASPTMGQPESMIRPRAGTSRRLGGCLACSRGGRGLLTVAGSGGSTSPSATRMGPCRCAMKAPSCPPPLSPRGLPSLGANSGRSRHGGTVLHRLRSRTRWNLGRLASVDSGALCGKCAARRPGERLPAACSRR